MGEKRIPKLMLLGAEQNETYMTLFYLYEKRHLSMNCYYIKLNEKRNTKELIHMAKDEDIVLIVIGSKEEYDYFKPVARVLKDRCILLFDTFEGRSKCLRKCNKNLLVVGEGKLDGVVSELLDIMIFDASIMLDYRDVFQCAGWRTEVRNEVFTDALEAVDKSEMHNMKVDEKKEISMLWLYGELDCCSMVEITNMMWRGEKGNVFGASYEDEHGYGMLTFYRDIDKMKKSQIQIENPFKNHSMKWLAVGCCALAFVCVVLGICLITLQDVQMENGALTATVIDKDCGVEIRTMKAVKTDGQGKESVRCEYDVVTVYGAEYERVGQAIEAQFPLQDMQGTLEMMEQFGTGANTVSRLECRRCDGRIISFKENSHYHTGGSGYLNAGYTFSVEEGKLLELEDILMDKEGFNEEIDGLIIKALSEHPGIMEYQVDYQSRYEELYAAKDRLPEFLLSTDGMTFLFEQGDFLAMVFGCIEATVDYEEVEQYIRKEYR